MTKCSIMKIPWVAPWKGYSSRGRCQHNYEQETRSKTTRIPKNRRGAYGLFNDILTTLYYVAVEWIDNSRRVSTLWCGKVEFGEAISVSNICLERRLLCRTCVIVPITSVLLAKTFWELLYSISPYYMRTLITCQTG